MSPHNTPVETDTILTISKSSVLLLKVSETKYITVTIQNACSACKL